MKDILSSLDWTTILGVIWTAIILPVGTKILTSVNRWLEARKLDKYGQILYDEVKKAVKAVYESVVKDIKGTDEWTEDKMNEVRELAKTKILQALPTIVYKVLNEANEDFGDYLDSLIDTALYDTKHEEV
ncbi:hypothetical protein [Coprococcus sp. RTP21281st1_F1_RTP21281_210402]|uniref:hypothetical protein n=1 Tax=Coprococcus sp. RTP21281st1_F1_RTP21281_210402 TaxID=3143208 RepID=UPI0034A39BFD